MEIVDALLDNYYPSSDTEVTEAPNAIQRSLENQITTFQLMSPGNATFEEAFVDVSAIKLTLDSASKIRVVFESKLPEGRHGTLGPSSTKVTAGKKPTGIERLEAAISLQLNGSQNLDMIRDFNETSM